ncbi:MAG: homocysteine S-methyltransferase family protein [Pseudomonadota bacterium]
MKAAVTILDGGMGQELVARTGAPPTGLWSTQLMIDFPQAVRDVHDDFFAAGAMVATTNSYAILRDRLVERGIEDRFAALHRQAVDTARASRDAFGCGQVAGSLGPLGWSYRPDLAPPAQEAAKLYGEMVELQRDGVDLFILETMAGVEQARGGLLGCVDAGRPVWLALSVNDADGTQLRSGEPLGDIAPLIDEYRPAAVLLNCSTPEAISAGMPIVANWGVPFGAYANGFTRISEAFLDKMSSVDALTTRTDLSPDAYANMAEDWVRQGATIVGGCCEVGPAHIAELARRFS